MPTPRRPFRPFRPFALAAACAAALAVVVAAPSSRGDDDRDLLRTIDAEPHVFFLLDTSSSMNADIDGSPLPRNGDDPASKIFLAKKNLYEVFESAGEFNYGFGYYNQDSTRVRAKHWLYRSDQASTWVDDTTSFAWPAAGELWVFGPLFRDASGDAITTAGDCLAPLDLANAADRRKAARFAKRSKDQPTIVWLEANDRTYKATVAVPSENQLGNANLPPKIVMEKLTGACPDELTSPDELISLDAPAVSFSLVGDFLYHEDPSAISGTVSGGLGVEETFGGSWNWRDAEVTIDEEACPPSQGSGARPFEGQGWEQNYDSASYVDADGQPASTPSGVNTPTNADPFCSGGECQNYHFVPTKLRIEGRAVDEGDVLPFDWATSNHPAFLTRLNPNYNTGLPPNFGIAAYFNDEPPSGSSFLTLRSPGRRPLVAAGASPLAKAINDFRCWYSEKANKCHQPKYDLSWEEVARATIGNDSGCVQPYLILVTDAENTCGGESPVADVAGLKSGANVRTWIIALARRDNKGECGDGQVRGITAPGKGGELICVENENELREALERIRGVIEEEARTFASAAVPTVQATVDDKVYVSNFVPVNNESVWPGTVNAFVKPLILDDTGRPDVESDSFRWSADEALLTQTAGLGSSLTQRRIYYTQEVRLKADSSDPPEFEPVPPGEYGTGRTFLQAPTAPTSGDSTPLERDLWRGLGVEFTPGDSVSEQDAREETQAILDFTLAVKSTDIDDETRNYLMGDVFHSDPTIIGAPSNVRYFAADLDGYRAFARRHENRRKVLVVGTNEGMLHAFDAGIAGIVNEQVDDEGNVTFPGDVKFTNGTGKELFAYVPRQMLGELRERAQSTFHDWGVDGSVKVADAFVDALFVDEPDPDDREWRTLLVGGFRRGGKGYYALDVTQPDAVEQEEVGLPLRTIFMPENEDVIPGCDDTTGTPDEEDCHDELAWPAARWEFQDTVWNDDVGGLVPLDEDVADPAQLELDESEQPSLTREGNEGVSDLSNSWSIPNLGRIRLCDAVGDGDGRAECLPSADPEDPDDLVDRYVAIFGGGLPQDPTQWGTTGNYLYIVDLETGLPIYKRQVLGSVPSEPAAVDTDNDGYLDRIYFGTTAGYMYRIDLVEHTVDGSGNRVQRPYPTLTSVVVPDTEGGLHAVERVPDFDQDEDGVADGLAIWRPKRIFDTLADRNDVDSTDVRRPIFFRPSVLFVAELGKYALSFGTGDREYLWRPTTVAGRFYTFVDDSDVETVTLPMTEDRLRRVEADGAFVDVNDPDVVEKNFLLHRTEGGRGWVMALEPAERQIADPFGLSGVTFFVTYTPRPATERGPCTRVGDSNIFAVNTTNANGFLRDFDLNKVRFISELGFATEPFTEPGQTKNPVVDSEGSADDLARGTHLEDVMNELKTLFPANCKFGNYRIDVKTVKSDTGVVFIAPVPVCIIEKNWKEFDS